MKNVKKLVAFMLTLAMILSMGAVVFAANGDTTKGSITVTNPQDGTTYKTSKIFDVTYDGDNYSYTIAADSPWLSAVQSYAGQTGTKTIEGDDPSTTDVETSYEVEYDADGLELVPVKNAAGTVVSYNVIQTKGANDEKFDAAKFAAFLMDEDNTPDDAVYVDLVKDTNTGAFVASDLDLGYWLLVPSKGFDPIVASLDTTNPDVEVVDKNEKPEVEKVITEDEGDNQVSEASVGDKIPYTLTTKVPNMTGYKTYFFVAKDTMSKGLTFNNDVKITVDGTELTATDFEVKTEALKDATSGEETGETLVRIIFKNMVGKYADKVGAPIVITYSATLNEDAAIDAPNSNDVFMQFSTDPSITPESDPGKDPDDPEDWPNIPTGEGPNSTTKTYTTKLTVNKVDDKNAALNGAKFKLEGTAENKVLVTGENYVPYAAPATGDAPQKYWKLKDGKFTTTDPTTGSVDQKLYDGFVDGATSQTFVEYMKVEEQWYESKTSGVSVEAFVENGTVSFSGLGAGTYTLTEVITPDGYNPIDPITVTVKFFEGDPKNSEAPHFYLYDEKDPDNQTITLNLNVVNTTGPVLPQTGGIGTTIFYVLGSILLVGAAVLLITKKRMSVNE